MNKDGDEPNGQGYTDLKFIITNTVFKIFDLTLLFIFT